MRLMVVMLHNTANALHATDRTLKNGYDGKFYFYFLYLNF